MNKTELVAVVAEKSGITKKALAEAYDALLKATEDTLVEGEGVQLAGFGTFSVKAQAACVRRNPRTNEPIEIPASRRLTFSASKTIKDKLNNK